MTVPPPHRRLRDAPLVAPFVVLLKPLLRPVAVAARRAAGVLHRRLWRCSPRTVARTARWAADVVRAVRRRRRETRLTVAVDVLALWEPLTGVGWYVYELLAAWAGRGDVVFRLYGLALVRAPGIPEATVELPRGPALDHVVYAVPDDLMLGQRWLVPVVRFFEPWLVSLDGNDVVFAPNYILPPPFRLTRAPVVATVHDLSVRRVPWAVRPDTQAALVERLDRALFDARLVLADSAAVGRELVELAGVEPSTVRVVHLGPGQATGAGGETAAEAALPAGAPRRFGLFVGTLEPRKNVPGLLAAWRLLRLRLPAAPPLVLVGGYGWRAEGIRREVEAAAAEGWLHHFGYVAHGELLALYRRSAVVVLPSFYEGFGFPAVEAMRSAAPLVLADLPVLREIGADAALYAPPDRPDEIADRLAAVLGDPALAADLAARGRRRGADFDWRRTAQATAAALAEAAGRRSDVRPSAAAAGPPWLTE